MRRNYQKYVNDFCNDYNLAGSQVARMLGVAEETIQQIRRGARKPQQNTKDKLNKFIKTYRTEHTAVATTQAENCSTKIIGIDSRTVAEWTGKPHKHLMRDIRQYTEYLKGANLGATDFWKETTYTASNGKENPCYMITKKGCEFIQHKMTGQKGSVFTAQYINYFHEMGEKLYENNQILLDLKKQSAPSISDLAYIKNKLAELQNLDNLSDIIAGIDRIKQLTNIIQS